MVRILAWDPVIKCNVCHFLLFNPSIFKQCEANIFEYLMTNIFIFGKFAQCIPAEYIQIFSFAFLSN